MTLALPGLAWSHELFLRPADHYPPVNSPVSVTLVSGKFDKSENAVARDRLADVSVLAGGKVTHPAPDQWHDADNAAHLKLATGAEGTYVVRVSTKPRLIELSAEDFDAYLHHEGIEDTLKARKAANAAGPVKERYSKHARTFLQVGARRTNDYAQTGSATMEIIPAKNPAELKVGDTFEFSVLLRDKPAQNQLVNASFDGYHGHSADGSHIQAYKLRTDARGRAGFKILRAGSWYVSLIHMEKVEDGEVNYESNWATATFAVR